MHERNLSSLAAKGKAKENVHWQLGWWDFSHTLEGTKRPIQWSKSSVIFTAHESQPLVVARHFPTSRQFFLPSPHTLVSALATYEPPSVLSVSAADDWFFAYFPGKGSDGVACLWRKGSQLDSWVVYQSWTCAVGSGVVAATWTSTSRDWVVSEAGTSTRLPPLGPLTPIGVPLLLLVTQCHQLHVCILPPFWPTLNITQATLLQPQPKESDIPKGSEPPGKVGGDKICMKAAIGLCYGDSTFMIAMRSQLLPSQTSSQALHNPLDISLPLDMSQPSSMEGPFCTEWELWGEEPEISLCEVHIVYRHGLPPAVSTHPLPPIYHPSSQLVDLMFFCPPPPPSPVSPVASAKHNPRNPGVRSQNLYLTATFLDVGDYSSLPKSEIVSYTFASQDTLSGPQESHWTLKDEKQRISTTKVPDFLVPSISRGGVLAGFLDAGGLLPRRKQNSKETTTGAIEVLKLPDLTTSEDWDSIPIRSRVAHGNVDVPVSVALSPNEALFACVSSSLLGSLVSVQVLPRRVSGGLASITASHLHGDLARQLVAAIRSRHSPSDVVHALSWPSLPVEVTVNTLFNAFSMMEADSYGHSEMWIAELLGVATEVYGARAKRLDRGPEKDLCALRAQTACDISSLRVCCTAFEACQEGAAYDLDAVWHLVGLSGWIIELAEGIFKECILIGENPAANISAPSTPSSTPKERELPDALSLDSPIFLHLVHPYALSRLQAALKHVKRFRDHVGKLAVKGENSQIAKDVLIDITDLSGIDLQQLAPLLTEILQDCKQLDAQDLRRSLASCSPAPTLNPHLRRVIERILKSKAIDRARLFIKPSDLIDGVSRLSLSEPGPRLHKGKEIDVVNKGLLTPRQPTSVCVRCGGRSEAGIDGLAGAEASVRWQVLQKAWRWRCVCGGQWVVTASANAGLTL